MSEPVEVLGGFAMLVEQQVQVRLVQSQELAQDARLIAEAWAQRDIESLVALQILDSDQANELLRLVYPNKDEPQMADRTGPGV